MAVTRNDVARLAGVSTAIVSYVINNGPRAVAPDTRARVLTAIHELGYNPSAVARSLRRQRTATIGVLVPTMDVILTEVIRGAQSIAGQRAYRVVYYDTNHDAQAELAAAAALIGERVEGVVWIPCTEDMSAGRKLVQSGIPVVIVDPPCHTTEFATVDIDNYQGGYLATRHLLELRHHRIGFIDRAEPAAFSRERLRGYQAALGEYGLVSEPALIVHAGPQIADGRDAAYALLGQPSPPTAIFAYADLLAVGVLRAAYTRQIAIPHQLSIISFDDIALAAFTCPALTTIAAPKFERGACGAQLLFDLVDQHHPVRAVQLPVQLVVRETTGAVL